MLIATRFTGDYVIKWPKVGLDKVELVVVIYSGIFPFISNYEITYICLVHRLNFGKTYLFTW